MESTQSHIKTKNRWICADEINHYILLCILLISCNNKSTNTHDQSTTNRSSQVTAAHSYSNTFYAVYELSANTTAVVINLGESEQETLFDSIVNSFHFTDSLEYDLQGPIINCKVQDTIGAFNLLRNPELENKLKRHFPQQLFVHGTKGSVLVNIEKVFFALDPCRTSFLAFCFDKKDNTSLGHPILASTQPIQMDYGESFVTVEKEINKFYSEIEADYKDTLQTRVFAQADSLYFAYSDDFSWNGKNISETCQFPMRSVFIAPKNKPLLSYWSDGLDLFGIPCD